MCTADEPYLLTNRIADEPRSENNGHYKSNVRDIEFNLFEVLGIGELLDAGAYGDLDTDTVRNILAEVARLAEGPVAASFADADRNPVEFDAPNHAVVVPEPLRKTVEAVNEAGWSRLGLPEGMGGVPAPAPLVWAIGEMLVAANGSASFFNMGPLMASVLYTIGNEQQKHWAKEGFERGWAGTMVLTEPDAGSDVAQAEQRQSRRTTARGTSRASSGSSPAVTSETRPRTSSTWCLPGPRRRSRNQRFEPVLRSEIPFQLGDT